MRLLSLLLLLCLALFGDDHHEKKEHLPLDMSHLHLTQTQYQEVRRVVKAFQSEHKAFHHLKKEAQKEISRIFLTEHFDIAAFTRMRSDLEARAVQIEAEFFSKIHTILTPKQKKAFVSYMKEWEVE